MGTDSDSNSIPVVISRDWNLNPTLCSVEASALCNVVIGSESESKFGSVKAQSHQAKAKKIKKQVKKIKG